ncbi:retrovirus-related pol polyprotein from transposon TNT 1-94 [Tanacetum coccineum]|uniref:Retrovirus-related pol polyprotein from transposon TNT 1-94 n=1 Tax=Tanacetum coccineum TaxID=301880 RepID=A0ABQ4YIK0_9ASTR
MIDELKGKFNGMSIESNKKKELQHLEQVANLIRDTYGSDSDCDLSLCDDFSPINIYEEKSVTFSNPLFDSNDDFTSSDDESLSDEDVPEVNDIETKDSYVSNLDEPALLVTPLSDDNKDECFDPGSDVDEIEFLLHRDPSKINVDSILEGFTDEPPLEVNDDLFYLESKKNEWKNILYDAPIDDLMTEDKIPSGESKAHIEVLSVLWGNRLPIPDGSLPLSSSPVSHGSQPNADTCNATTVAQYQQTDEELTEKELKQEIWLRVQQMMKGSDIGIQEKKAKLFNELERFTSTDGESIESYYHRFSKLMNDFKRNKHFPEKIASNLKFLNNLQLEWSRHVTIVHQTKDLHTADYTQLYDFLKYNQKEVDELRAERLARTYDPLALMKNFNNPFNYLVFHQHQTSSSTYMQQPQPTNNYNPQPLFNPNYMQQPMPNPKDITDLTTAMNMALVLMVKAFKLNNSTSTNNNQRISSNPCNRQIAQPVQNVRNQVVQNAVQNPSVQNVRNQNGLIVVPGIANQNLNRNGNVVAAQTKGNANGNNGNQIRCYNCRGLGHLARNCTAEEFDLMYAAADLNKIEEVNVNCILMANLQQASTSGTQTGNTPIYDLDGLAENDSNVIPAVSSVELDRGTVEQHPATVEETLLLEKHDPLAMYDSEETLQLAQESRQKMKQLNKEIKQTNYTKINHLSRVFVSQMAKSREELYFSNTSKTANVSKSISIPNEEFLDDTSPSVARNFLNEVKTTIVTLQRVVKQKMTLDVHNWSSSVHQEIHKIIKDKNFPIVNPVDARVQNFEIHILKEAAKFVQDFKSLANEADESIAKQKALEYEIVRLLRAVVSQDIMFIMLNLLKNEYAKLWNDWYKKSEECKYDKILYNKAYNDMQQKIKRLQAQLGDQKGKSKDTSCISNTLDPLSQKLENENVELEFQVLNYAKENAHLKITYKNLFDSINVTRTQTKTIIDSLQNKIHDTIYENAKLRAQLFDKISEQKDITKGMSANTKFTNQSTVRKPSLQSLRNNFVVRQPNAFQSERQNFSKPRDPQKVDEMNDLSNLVTSNSIPTPQESKVVKNDNVIAPRMFRINPSKTSREERFVPINKNHVNSDSHGLSSIGVDNTTKTRRPQPRSNTKNDRVPSASKSSCIKNKEFEVEEHHRNLLFSKNKKPISSKCNKVKLAIQNDKSKVVYAMCKQCLITANHDVCVLNYVNSMNSRGKKQKENASNVANQKKHKPKIRKPNKVGSKERFASPKPKKPRTFLRWSPTSRIFNLKGKIIASSEFECESNYSNGDNACTSNPQEPTIKRFPNSTSFLARLSKFVYGTVRFGNDHVAAILGYGDLQWGNILITKVYFVEGLGHNLFSIGQFCDSDFEVAFRRNTCFVKNLEGVDLLKGNCSTNLYTINLHDMASASPICLMARATSTKSWLWHQHLSHLNFDTINDLARNDLVNGLPKFKYHKQHLCPSCEQEKSKRHLTRPNLFQILSRDDYSRYTWVHFLRSKDETPEEIKTFLKKIIVLLQAPVIMVRTDKGT